MPKDALFSNLQLIATIRAGFPFRSAIREVEGSGVAAIQLKNCQPGQGIDWSSVIETEIVEKASTPWLRDGDVLFTARGDRNHAVTFREPEDTRFPRGCVAAPHFYVLRCQPHIVPEFLAWQLNSAPCQRYFDSTAVGSVTKSISKATLSEATIYLPSINKQLLIVDTVQHLYKQKRVLQKLMENGDRLMDTIARDLPGHASRDVFEETITLKMKK